MRRDKRPEKLSLLFDAFESPYSFYVLGAGASAGIVPMTTELRRNILKRFFDFGLFRAEIRVPDDLFHRVIGDPNDYKDQFTSELLRYLHPSAVHVMVIKELTPPRIIRNVHAYEIFQFIKKPSTIFSINVDGLSARYCRGHYLFEPHGRVPDKLTNSPYWNEYENYYLEFDSEPPKIPGLHLPIPETINITSKVSYQRARDDHFRYANDIIFIGYSFGLFKESLDDIETFEFFRELLRYYSKRVIVLSPDPEFIGNAIEESAKLSKVNLLKLYWNHLCQAIMEKIYFRKCNQFQKLKSLMSEILYRHDQLRELNHNN
jgi:hypothetical protein